VKSIQIIVHEAVDGKRFDNADQCAEHEVAILDQLLASLNPDLIKDALKRAGIVIRIDRSGRLRLAENAAIVEERTPRKGVIQKIAERPGAERTERADA
jgi:hypothetical protein